MVWTPTMQRELAVQTKKWRKRFTKARASGTIPDDKWTPADEADLHETMKQERSKKWRKRFTEARASGTIPDDKSNRAPNHPAHRCWVACPLHSWRRT